MKQIHNPFVHGFTVGPTLNPFCLFNNILFIKYDLPVRYIPATDITPNSDFNDFITSSPCSVKVNTILYIYYILILLLFVLESYTKNGIGQSFVSIFSIFLILKYI